MKPLVTRLQLNKETLIALQDKQIRAIRGGAEVSMSFCEPTMADCPLLPATVLEAAATEGDTCCKKSCRGKQQ